MRVTEHFYNNKLLVGNQFGFRKGVPTEDAIFKLTNEILNDLNNKAMAYFGIPDYVISVKAKLLLKSYLWNRYKKV